MTTPRATTGTLVRFEFPYPLSGLYQKILSTHQPSQQYGYTLRLAEGVFKFLALVNLVDALSRGASRNRARKWLQAVEQPSMGKWLHLLQSTTNWLDTEGGPFLVEVTDLLSQPAWDRIGAEFPNDRNYYCHRLLAVSETQARTRRQALAEPLFELLSGASFLRHYELGVCVAAEEVGPRRFRMSWRPSRGLAEAGPIMELTGEAAWPKHQMMLADTRRMRGLVLSPFLVLDDSRDPPVICWLDGVREDHAIYRHPVIEPPPTEQETALPFPHPYDRKHAGLTFSEWQETQPRAAFDLTLDDLSAALMKRLEAFPDFDSRYRLIGTLGVGAMGTVYEAEDLNLGRRVALKRLNTDLMRDAEQRHRFQREARLLLKLQHPGVVRMYDETAWGDSRVLIMELLEGEDLWERIRTRGPLDEEEAVGIVLEVLEALEYIHGQDVLHRDVKPSNVVRTADRAVLIDFGIAKARDGTALTRVEGLSRMGTDAYMSPEQRQAAPIDRRTDVYGAGRLLFALLAGRHPTPHSPLTHDEEAETLADVDVQVSARVIAVQEKATRTRVSDRFASAREMADALRGKVVLAPSEPPEPFVTPTLDGPRGLVTTGLFTALGFFVFAAGAALFTTVFDKPPEVVKPAGPWQGRSKSTGIEFRRVQPGSFWMGSAPDEANRQPDENRHKVALTRPFWLSETEVTQSQYESLLGTNPSTHRSPSLPVHNVTWMEAIAFANRLSKADGLQPAYVITDGGEVTWNASANGYRLPTEAEWEYAARAGESHRYSGSDEVAQVGWVCQKRPCTRGPRPVAGLRANPWGFYDMTGNVYEWVWDRHPCRTNDRDCVGRYPTTSVDPAGVGEGSERVYRGGSWMQPAKHARIANRGFHYPDRGYPEVGFRLARNSH